MANFDHFRQYSVRTSASVGIQVSIPGLNDFHVKHFPGPPWATSVLTNHAAPSPMVRLVFRSSPVPLPIPLGMPTACQIISVDSGKMTIYKIWSDPPRSQDERKELIDNYQIICYLID